EYTVGVACMPQAADGTRKLRDCPAPITGPPNAPPALRASRMRHGVAAKKSSDRVPGGAKYPLTSMIRSVALVAITVIAPPAPARMIAMSGVTVPAGAFSGEEPGLEEPAGQALRKPSGPVGTTVRLKAYAWAVAGI